MVLGWLSRITNGHFRVGGTPGLHPGVFSVVPTGLNLERVVLTQTLKAVIFSVLELEEFAQATGLCAAYRDLSLLAIIHAQLLAALEPGHDFFDVVDVHHVGTVGSPENGWIQQL